VTQIRKELINKLWWGREPFAGFPDGLFALDTQGWSSSHAYLKEAIDEIEPRIVVEIGVWKGGSTITMAKRMQELKLNGAIIAIDTWLGSREHWLHLPYFNYLNFVFGYPTIHRTFMANIVNLGLVDYVIPLPTDSHSACEILRQHDFKADVIHLDASHDYEAVIADLTAWWPLLKDSGIFIGDDYRTDGGWPGVRRAFDEFFGELGLTPFEFVSGKCRIRKPCA
jgi:hypothetical protein